MMEDFPRPDRVLLDATPFDSEGASSDGSKFPTTFGPHRCVGVGLRPAHFQGFLEGYPQVGFLELVAENFLGAADFHAMVARTLRHHYPVSVHCVGLSLGSASGVDEHHLCRVKELVERVEPFLVSDHLSWSVAGTIVINELLPLPFTEVALDLVVSNVQRVQEFLRRPILIENIAAYVRFRDRDMEEADFLNQLARRSGCQLLVDLTNLHVNCGNHAEDELRFLHGLDASYVGQFHLAGHSGVAPQRLDDHGARISTDVWNLFEDALHRFGARPTTVEWDNHLPELAVLLDEARKADQAVRNLSNLG